MSRDAIIFTLTLRLFLSALVGMGIVSSVVFHVPVWLGLAIACSSEFLQFVVYLTLAQGDKPDEDET